MTINMEKPYVVGMDIGGTNTVFGVVDSRGNVLASDSVKTQQYENIDDYVDAVCKKLLPLLSQFGGAEKIKGMGVGAPNGNYYSGTIEFAVVGIGLNLFEASDGYPDALQEIAGGIYESREAAAGLDRSRLAAEIVNTLLEETKELKLPDEYIQHNMVPGREICISDGNSIRRVKALEICPDGRLKVQEEDGTVSILSYGEVSIIM